MKLIERIKSFKYIKHLLFLIFILILITLIAIRINLILKLPIFAYIDYIDDDELMVQQAKSIVCGNWLGLYGYNTFLKGPVFPLYLAVLYFLKMPYLVTTTLIYSLTCCLFIYSIKDLIKNKFLLLIVFVLMLFNPIMYSIEFQRVYRNSLTPCLAFLLISFYNIALLNRNNPKVLKYIIGMIGVSIIYPFFYYIREDSIWIVPFVLFYSFIIVISNVIDLIKCKKVKVINIIKIVLLFLPLVTIIIFECIIGNINYKYYQGKVVNSNDFKSLNDAIHAISIVKDCSKYPDATNSRDKIKMLYNYSETLNSIKDSFEHTQDLFAGYENGEVPNGIFLWTILVAASRDGYDTYSKQEELFSNIADEINSAIDSGELETQKLVPFFNDVNIKMFNVERFLKEVGKAIKEVNKYNFSLMDTYGSLYNSEFFEVRIRLFLEMTNDRLLLNDEENSWKSFGELVKTNQMEYINEMQPKIDTLNYIKTVYTYVSYIIEALGYISYVALSVILIVQTIRKDNKDVFNIWILSSGLVGSMLVLCTGVAYTSITKVYAVIPFYLMSGYILNILFCMLSIIGIVNFLFTQISKKSKKRRSN